MRIMRTGDMSEQVREVAKIHGLTNTSAALDYAINAHEGQLRKNSDIPYINQPLNVACHAIALDVIDDEILAACLLHDVVEDCDRTYDELPVNDDVRNIVRLLTREHPDKEHRDEYMQRYYAGIAKDPRAALIKCIDRCHNITTMAKGLSPDKVRRYIVETRKYYPALLDAVESVPKYENAAWLLRYQIKSMLSIYSTYCNGD